MVRIGPDCRASALVAAFLFAILRVASANADNIRFTLFTGGVIAENFGAIETGGAVGAGFEVEKTATWSVVGDLEYSALNGSYSYVQPYPPYPRSKTHDTASTVAFQLGFRGHLFARSRVRPFLQVGLGARLGGTPTTPYYSFEADGGSGAPDLDSISQGAAASLRVGVTAARFGGTGVFLDGGVVALIENPQDYALVPIRLGISFR